MNASPAPGFRKGQVGPGPSGIRREKLHLCLRDYAWRYNHRNKNDYQKIKRIIKLLEHEIKSLEWDDTHKKIREPHQ